jgi:uncharacterized protein
MSAANNLSPSVSLQSGLLARHPLVFFFLMAYAFSWLAWMPWVLSEDGAGLLPYDPSPRTKGLLNIAAMVLGPTLSAFIMTGATEGRAGIHRLLRRYVLWRVGLRWYLFALVGLPVIMALGAIVLPGALASFDAAALPSVLTYLGFFILVLVLGGPLLEEPGWRGFALPRLQRLHGPLVGSLILGVLWALWHLPEFLSPSWQTPKGSILDIVWFVFAATAFAIVMTWLFNHAKGSLLIVILAHASADTFNVGQFFPVPIVTGSLLPLVIGVGALALLLVAVTRGRLGYRQEELESASHDTKEE